jgi:hypothetical protein
MLPFYTLQLNNYTAALTADLFVSGFDTSGAALWSASCGRSANDFAQSVAAFGGNVFVTGHYRDTVIAFGRNLLYNYQPENKDVFLASLTPPIVTSPLPVELISFTGKRLSEHQVVLEWVTASESNNERFDVERSTDCQGFIPIGSRPGSCTTSFERTYSFVDASAPSYRCCYRLIQTDFDGQQHLIEPVVVDATGGNQFSVVSNPVVGKELFYNVTVERGGNGEMVLFDLQGRLCLREVIEFSSGVHTYRLDVSALSSGAYFTSVIIGGRSYPARIIIP